MANYADSTRTPRILTEREQRALLKVTGERRAGYRDHVLYAMALGTGLREHELIALSVGDVFRDGRPRRRLLLSVFKGAQRTGGTQEVLLSESLRGKLRRFHQWKARERERLDDTAPLSACSSSIAPYHPANFSRLCGRGPKLRLSMPPTWRPQPQSPSRARGAVGRLRWTKVRKRMRSTSRFSSACLSRHLPRAGSARAIHRDRFHASVAITE